MCSPGLEQFRTSPFRILRLAPSATAQQAVWQCDKALARARVGLPMLEPDPVPWLPAGDEVEIQRAVQTIESPLVRIIEQLLWFDVAEDAERAALIEALATCDASRLHGYLAADGAVSIVRRINAANLRLLLGFSLLRDTGPARVRRDGNERSAVLAWQCIDGVSLVENPHTTMRPNPEPSREAATWDQLLGNGVTAWGELLASAELGDHICARIAALGDELLTADDCEAVITGLQMRVADLIAGETKLETASGRLNNVSRLSSIAGKSQIGAEVWLMAFRPLQAQFQAELADLAPDSESGLGVVEDVGAYLERVSALVQRWRSIDEAQLLGLAMLIDDAVEAAFARLREASTKMHTSARFSEVLMHIGEIAQSLSLKERIKGYQDRLVDIAKRMCHFCGKREMEIECCLWLQGRKKVEIHRDSYDLLNERFARIQRDGPDPVMYKVVSLPVARCKRCAALHEFVGSMGRISVMSISVSITLISIFLMKFISIEHECIIIFIILMILISALMCFIGNELVKASMAARVISCHERNVLDYETSSAAEIFRSEEMEILGYGYQINTHLIVGKHP